MRRKRTELANPLFGNTFHVTQRCTRQDALLHDSLRSHGKFQSRRAAILDRIRLLASAFAIDVLRFSIMSNHLHAILRNRPDIAQKLSDREVVERWLRICPGYCCALADYRNKPGEPVDEKEIQQILRDRNRVAELRMRLSSVSYFMWALNNYTSKLFNLIDGKSGCFWQSRYKIKQLLDDLSLLVCGIYVDLNPIRAGAAKCPEESHYTSIFFNLQAAKLAAEILDVEAGNLPDAFFAPITIPSVDSERSVSKLSTRASDQGFTTLTQHEYFMLVDVVGRILRKEKSGSIPAGFSPIFERLNLNWESLAELVNSYEGLFKVFVGSRQSLESRARELGGGKLRCPAEKGGHLP